jgi:hypothetical protein
MPAACQGPGSCGSRKRSLCFGPCPLFCTRGLDSSNIKFNACFEPETLKPHPGLTLHCSPAGSLNCTHSLPHKEGLPRKAHKLRSWWKLRDNVIPRMKPCEVCNLHVLFMAVLMCAVQNRGVWYAFSLKAPSVNQMTEASS